jgi:hypothetical protein
MMKGKRFLRTAALAAVFAAALLTACEQAALPEVLPHTEASVPGMGTVTVRATAAGAVRSREAGAARTVAPDFAEAAFDTYDLTFSGGTTIPAKTVPAEDIGTPIKLPEGDYTLTVTARKGDDPIATGTASVTVKIDEPQTVEVFLSPETGGADGTFSYNVTFRAGTKGVLTLTDTAGNAVKDSAGDTVEPITLTGNKTGTVEKLRPGVYLLAGAITRDDTTVNFTNETVYLYSGLESAFKRNFSLVLPVKVESLAEVLEFLSTADANDIDHPYPLDLSGLTLADLTKGDDPLGELFASLSDNIYVDLDLSGCAITEIADIASDIVNSRPNKNKIVSVTLPDSLEAIGDNAFRGFTSLTSIDLPDSLTSLGTYAFTGCTSLATIDLTDTHLYYFNYSYIY